jgi:flagellar biosynthesis protein FlhG
MNVMMDQATSLRTLVRESQRDSHGPSRRASVVAIASGKGGVGKSNVAVNLAVRLSAAGRKVVLLDADMGLANVDVLCNVDAPLNLSHVVTRRRELSEVILNAPGGFRLISGASGMARMADLEDADRQRVLEGLATIESDADYILIDTGAGISQNVLTFAHHADQVLVVTTPEPTAVTDAYALIKMINRQPGVRRLSLLVNQAADATEGQAVYNRVAKVARQFLGITVFDAGYIPTDEAVPKAVRQRVPFMLSAPRSQAAAAVGRLAARLEEGLQPAESGGFFRRMSGWLRK